MSSPGGIKTPRLARKLLNVMSAYRYEHSIQEDFEETFVEILHSEGRFKAHSWYWGNALKSLPQYLRGVVVWRFTMLRNYLKITYRNLARRKLYSFINIVGLAIGLSICIFIILWVQQELSFDRFHAKADRIYRVERRILREDLYSRWPIVGGAYRQALLDDFPEIESAARFWGLGYAITDHQDTVHRQSLFAADNEVFEIFDFGLEEGDERTALVEPKTVVLTRKNAQKYFGTADVIGRSLPFQWGDEMADFKVTGILKEVPANSHIHFDMLISIASFPAERFSNWRSNYLYTYVLLKGNASKTVLEEKFKSFVNRRLEPEYRDLYGQQAEAPVLQMKLFPLTDIHLHPSVNWEIEGGGSIESIYIFSTVAIFLLLIACINFITLSTARAGKRAKEVGLRKTVGAGRGQLKRQFIFESLLSAMISLGLAFVICASFIPVFNQIMAEKLSTISLLQVKNIVLCVSATLLAGILSGLYPAFYLTGFDPVDVLKGRPTSGRAKSVFRKNMVVIQFVISTVLLIAMFTVYEQMQFVRNRSLGFAKDNLIIIPARSQKISQSYDLFRAELLQSTRVSAVSATFDLPGNPFFSNGDFYRKGYPEDYIDLIILRSDYDYLDTLNMEILAGRGFSREFGQERERAIILNEAAVKRIGWTPEEAVGQIMDRGDPDAPLEVIGVVKNFNFKSLRREVEPAVIVLSPDRIRAIAVRTQTGDAERNLKLIQAGWEKVFPGEQFEYSFMDGRLEQQYSREYKMQRIFVVFAALSILVACLGLFGLAAYTAEVRTKEIGIRKTLGASMGSVTLLLSKDFIKWIIIANIIAWPAAYYFMNRWLQNFAYRIQLDWEVFLISLLLLLTISWCTVVFQALKAGLANPVDALRYE